MNKYLTIACAAALSTLMACSGGKGNADKSTDSTAAAETAKETVQAEDSTGNPNASVMDLTIDGFNSKVMDFSGDMPKFLGARPCVIDFYATWCGPCQRMAPMIEILAQKYGGKVDFYRVDVDKEKDLAGDVFGIEAFLPGSQIDVKPIRDYDIYVDKTMEFKVVKINQEFRNVVVSHKALIEAELEAQKQVIMSKLEKGQILEGTVKNITSYGVFVDLGGVDGLIHITDLSWGRVNHPEEIVALDQKINVVILDFDEAKKRIALGLKQLTPHPWEALDQTLKVGDKVKGRVVVMADYGAFVEIAPGVEGLIHVSEMSWSQHLRSAQEFMKVGDEVEAVILTLDREERKMSLGIKQLTPDPWENIEVKYPVGTKTTAKVRNFTNFGVFVEIEEGIDGLIHISDLSWTKKVKHPGEFTSVGADIEVVVLEIDKENRRLSLGHKQLEENPWNEFENQYSVDSIHEGTITEMTDKGAVVALGENIEGFCPARQLVKEDGTTPKTGDKLNFKILEFSKATKRITLSHLRTYEEAKRAEIAAEKAEKRAAADATKSTVKKINASVEKTTLGDIAGLAALKSAMEAAEAKSAKKAAAKKEDEE